MALASRYNPTVRSVENGSNGNRGFKNVVMASSSTHVIGGLFDPRSGTAGAQTFAANQKVRGVVVDIQTFQSGNYISVFEAPSVPGTLVQPTATVPGKYTTTASNATATFPDIIVYEDININDSFDVYLSNGSGVPVNRGTTAASAVINNYIEPDPNYPYMVLESGASATATGLNFQIVGRPANLTQVTVKLINSDGAVS
jgi:hypothetical protein